jgi:hypothetical protein
MQLTKQSGEILKQQIRNVLFETIRILCPVNVDPDSLIKPHNWRDRKYVGEKEGRVVTWRGYSANLVAVDFRYRAIFIDFVDNVLSQQEKVQLFGEDFAQAISDLPYFVIMFVLDFPLETLKAIKDQGRKHCMLVL